MQIQNPDPHLLVSYIGAPRGSNQIKEVAIATLVTPLAPPLYSTSHTNHRQTYQSIQALTARLFSLTPSHLPPKAQGFGTLRPHRIHRLKEHISLPQQFFCTFLFASIIAFSSFTFTWIQWKQSCSAFTRSLSALSCCLYCLRLCISIKR